NTSGSTECRNEPTIKPFSSIKSVNFDIFSTFVAYCKNQKPHNIGEELLKPGIELAVRNIFGENKACTVNRLPLSNSTVKRGLSRRQRHLAWRAIPYGKK